MMSDRILVTGATGFVGRALCAELAARGFDVHCAVRDRLRSAGLPGRIVETGEIGPDTDWDAPLRSVGTVIHLAARAHVLKEAAQDPVAAFRSVNVEGTNRLAMAAARNGVRRLVMLSSIGVNGSKTAVEPFSESSVPAPYNLYSASKYEAEKVLRKVAENTELEVVILRPPLIYGPGNPGNFLRLLKLLRLGLPLPLGAVENRRSMLFLGNCIDAIIVSATRQEAAGNTYLLSDGEDLSTSGLIRQLALLMNTNVTLLPVPLSLLRTLGRWTTRSDDVERLLGSLQLDSSKIRRELSWKPPYTVDAGLAQTVQWFVGGAGEGV